jgi:hypothetical protein
MLAAILIIASAPARAAENTNQADEGVRERPDNAKAEGKRPPETQGTAKVEERTSFSETVKLGRGVILKIPKGWNLLGRDAQLLKYGKSVAENILVSDDEDGKVVFGWNKPVSGFRDEETFLTRAGPKVIDEADSKRFPTKRTIIAPSFDQAAGSVCRLFSVTVANGADEIRGGCLFFGKAAAIEIDLRADGVPAPKIEAAMETLRLAVKPTN